MAEPTKITQIPGTQSPAGMNPGTNPTSSTQSASGTAARTAREQQPGQSTSTEQDWTKSAKENFEQAARKGEEMYEKTRENVTEAYDRASRSMQATLDQAVDYGRNNPGTATLIAFGAGVGVGLLIASNLNSRSRSQRMVPPVMKALSDIALEFFR